jgi:hypothetical protein
VPPAVRSARPGGRYRERVPEPTADRPADGLSWPLVAAAMLALQGVVVLAFAVFYVVRTDRGFSTFNVLASAALFLVGGLGLLLVARGLLNQRRWARSPALTWQIVLLPVSYGLLQSGLWYVGVPLALTAVLAMRGLFAVPAHR